MRRTVMVLWVGLCLFWGSGTAKAVGGWYNAANYDPLALCGGVTPGSTSLLELQVIPTGSPEFLAAMWATSLQYPKGDNGQTWRYSSGPAYTGHLTLTGDILVDWYKAFDRASGASCVHGAEIVAYYDFGPADPPLEFDWISLYTEAGGSGTDVLRVDGDEDLNPAYYAAGDIPWAPDGYVLDPAHDGVFTDAPQDPHLESLPWSGGVEFYTFLAGYSAPYVDGGVTYQDIVFYDGFRWGYEGECVVPVPGALLLAGVGACLVVRLRERRVL